MEIKNNELLRQFEMITDSGLITIEYAIQERKLFLTKFCANQNEDEALHHEFIIKILNFATEKNLKVVPTYSKFVTFFRKNRKYQELLAAGIKV